MLIKRWKTLLLCICLQYVHGLFAQLAHRLHKPLPHPLEDLGYQILPVRKSPVHPSQAHVSPIHLIATSMPVSILASVAFQM
jgi:hypothetical protein